MFTIKKTISSSLFLTAFLATTNSFAMNEDNNTSLDYLPDDVVLKIGRMLNVRSASRLSTTGSRYHRILNSDDQWRDVKGGRLTHRDDMTYSQSLQLDKQEKRDGFIQQFWGEVNDVPDDEARLIVLDATYSLKSWRMSDDGVRMLLPTVSALGPECTSICSTSKCLISEHMVPQKITTLLYEVAQLEDEREEIVNAALATGLIGEDAYWRNFYNMLELLSLVQLVRSDRMEICKASRGIVNSRMQSDELSTIFRAIHDLGRLRRPICHLVKQDMNGSIKTDEILDLIKDKKSKF